ncbi:MAG: LpxI family protein [Veillonellaceae bacterium]|nr:LpxI family protein [Veillonellaceae bacterium]
MKKIGLIAGVGRLPVEFARAARGMGVHVIGVGVLPEVDPELAQVAHTYESINIAKLDRIFKVFKREQVTEITLLGKITKELVYAHRELPDLRVLKIFSRIKNFSDDTLTLALVEELAAEGITVLDQTELLRPLMPAAGVLTRRQPTEAELADMRFGLAMAKQIGGLDIGQTVVVKNRAIMAVEAIEGTDACIRRGGQLGRGGVTVAKAAKPKQDMRFDVPGIGPDTLDSMIESGAVALVIEAGKTLIVDREKMVAKADQHGITIVAMAGDEAGAYA